MRAMRKKLDKQLFTEILQNTCSYKFRKFYSQILMLESLFNKVVSLKVWKLKILMLRVPIYYVLEQEVSIGMRAMRKKSKIFMLQLLIYYTLELEVSIGTNEDIGKTKREKQIVFVVERWMQCLLLRLKSRSAREASSHAASMGNCPTVSHTCLVYLSSDEFFFLFLVQLNKMSTLGGSKFLFLFLVLISSNEEWR